MSSAPAAGSSWTPASRPGLRPPWTRRPGPSRRRTTSRSPGTGWSWSAAAATAGNWRARTSDIPQGGRRVSVPGGNAEVADLGLGADVGQVAQDPDRGGPGGAVVVHRVPGLDEFQVRVPPGQLGHA